MFEPIFRSISIIFIGIVFFKYLGTCIHEFGHFLFGKIVGFEIQGAIIGEELHLKILSFKLFGTPFTLNYGAGGSTSAKINNSNNNVKLRMLVFVLGGVLLQIMTCCIAFFLFGFGNDRSYYLPFVFLLTNLWSIIRSIIPRHYNFSNELFPSYGLRVVQIIQMKPMEIEHCFKDESPDADAP